jgi:tetratricopeptide (TPR) repeat protein
VPDDLRRLWDFDDLEASEQRLRSLLAEEEDAGTRAEILTQLARAEGLRDDVEQGERLLREAEALSAGSPRARARIDLERGRLLRSGGDPATALPLFESAAERAAELGELFIAGDAAHMAAIAAPTREARLAWTVRGIEVSDSGDGSGSYWLGPLLNNLGWDQYEAGEHVDALATFERALAARERDQDNPQAIAIAHYAVAKALQALNRHEQALEELERADEAWRSSGGAPDGWFHEAFAESYGAVHRASDAREHAVLALSLLPEADSSFEGDDERRGRLTQLAGDDV